MLMTDAWSKISVLLDSVIYGTTIPLTTRIIVFNVKIIIFFAQTRNTIFYRDSLWNHRAVNGASISQRIHIIFIYTYTSPAFMFHVWRANAFINLCIPHKTRKTIALNWTLLWTNRKRNRITVELALSLVEIPTPIICAITLI